MRIIQYHRRAASGDGGITNSVRQLSMAMARAGAEPVILCEDDAPAVGAARRGVASDPSHRSGGRPGRPLGGGAIADADVVVLNSAWTVHNPVVGRAARRAGHPVCAAPRGAYDPRLLDRRRLLKRAWWLLGERRLVRRPTAVHVFFEPRAAHIGPSATTARSSWRRTVSRSPRASAGSESGDHLLYLGRYDPEHKGLDLLLQAVALAGDDIPPLRMHGSDWAGGKDTVRRLVASLGLEDRVVIGEHLSGDEKWEAFVGARAFVYPSRWEAFGNSTAEAAALGVPTLVTPYPLGEHLAEPGGAAMLAAPDPVALAEGLRQRRGRGGRGHRRPGGRVHPPRGSPGTRWPRLARGARRVA